MNTEIEPRVCAYNNLKNDFIFAVILHPKQLVKRMEKDPGILPTTEEHCSPVLHFPYELFLILFVCLCAQVSVEAEGSCQSPWS